jgi:hypothetical protein
MPELRKTNGEFLTDVNDEDVVTVISRIQFNPTGLQCGCGKQARSWWFRSSDGLVICPCHKEVAKIAADIEANY